VRGIVEFCGQGCENTVQVRKHIVVPEADNPKVVFRKPPITFSVSGRIGMLTAIHFHNQTGLIGKKVRYKRPDWNLSSKFE
jgi:hypothetical protein